MLVGGVATVTSQWLSLSLHYFTCTSAHTCDKLHNTQTELNLKLMQVDLTTTQLRQDKEYSQKPPGGK